MALTSREAQMKVETNNISAAEIAAMFESEVYGSADREIRGANFSERATADELAFIGDSGQIERLEQTSAAIVLVPNDVDCNAHKTLKTSLIPVSKPESAFLQVAQLLHPIPPTATHQVSEDARIDPSAVIGANTTIHPFAVIAADVEIGTDCEIGAGVCIGPGSRLGDKVRIDANVVIYANTEIGDDCMILANAVIGGDGFGYETIDGRHVQLPHVGKVVIENDVHIGAGTTIDRAKMGVTRIGTGTRIDNAVVIGHNCQIGPHNLLVSLTGIAGSCTTGKYVVCAGQVGVADHVHLGDGAIIGAKAGVHRDMKGGEAYLGSPAIPAKDQARAAMVFRRLPEMRSSLKQLEKQVAALQQQLADQESQRKVA